MARTAQVIVVGAGFSGLGMGIRLKQAGIHDFIILEKADEIGGTWRDNHYPGAACDVPSHLYSYSFEPWPEWTRAFAEQREILAYLKHCARKYGLLPHIRLGSGAARARFDEERGLWTVDTTDGESLTTRVLVMACGPLTKPALPDIAGLASFEGKTFHSARWDHETPLDGKRVAIIGTGASAIQIGPAIAPKVARLLLFQRSAPWIFPKPDGPIPARTRAAYRRSPALQKLAYKALYWQREFVAFGMVYRPSLLKLGEHLAVRFLERSVPDKALRAKLLPRYQIGCKRVLPTNDWYATVQRDNVDLVTEGIAEVRARSIVTRDGTEHPVDVIVLATGFQASEHMAPFEIRGTNGTLDAVWGDDAEAYLGTTVAGFPNLFTLIGPNTGLGHTSMVVMIEAQLAYVLDAVQTIRTRNLRSVEVRPDVQASYNAEIQERLKDSVWAAGCMSWYLTRSGKNTTIWPGFTFEFRRRTRRFDVENYDTAPLAAANATSVTATRRRPAAIAATEGDEVA